MVIFQYYIASISSSPIKGSIINTQTSFNFIVFQEEFKTLFGKEAPSNEFLEWLIGFTEGDGSFVVNHRGDCSFI